jgi:hypothetical protein
MWNNIMDYQGDDKDHFRKQYCTASGSVTRPNTNYDYHSIMHYPISGSFVLPDNGCPEPTPYKGKKTCLAMVPIRLKEQEWDRLGQRDYLSESDIQVVNDLYQSKKPPPPTQQSCVTISTKTTVTDRNGTTTSSTTTSTSGNCAPGGHTHKPGKSHDHKQGCPVTCCWRPDRRCCHTDWCHPRRHAIGPWRFPPPPWWADNFWPRSHFDDRDDW